MIQDRPSSVSSPEGPDKLKRQLRLPDVVAVYVGNILGSGIFVAPAVVAAALPGVAGAWLWILGGMIAACGAAVYAECGVRLPRTGGFYVCYRQVYGEAVAFVGGWAALLVTYPASIAAIALIFGRYLGEIVPAVASYPTLPATTALVLVAAINIVGVRTAVLTQRVLTGVKVAALALVCLAAMVAAGGSGGPAAGPSPSPDGSDPASEAPGDPIPSILVVILGATVVVLWTYDGWSDLNLVAGEIRNPGRVLGAAVILGMSLLILVYVAVQVAVGSILPPGEAATSDRVLSAAVQAGLGGGFGVVVALLVSVATFGSVHGIVLAASRLGYAMARDGTFFRWFGKVHPAFGTPARAIAALSAASVIYVWVATFRDLLAFFSFAVWIREPPSPRSS
jgi:APA family basic amino acid/polyamine antiporter